MGVRPGLPFEGGRFWGPPFRRKMEDGREWMLGSEREAPNTPVRASTVADFECRFITYPPSDNPTRPAPAGPDREVLGSSSPPGSTIP